TLLDDVVEEAVEAVLLEALGPRGVGRRADGLGVGTGDDALVTLPLRERPAVLVVRVVRGAALVLDRLEGLEELLGRRGRGRDAGLGHDLRVDDVAGRVSGDGEAVERALVGALGRDE